MLSCLKPDERARKGKLTHTGARRIHQLGSQGLVKPSSRTCGHTCPAQPHAHHLNPSLTASLIAATVAHGIVGLLSSSRHGLSAPQPSPASGTATVIQRKIKGFLRHVLAVPSL